MRNFKTKQPLNLKQWLFLYNKYAKSIKVLLSKLVILDRQKADCPSVHIDIGLYY